MRLASTQGMSIFRRLPSAFLIAAATLAVPAGSLRANAALEIQPLDSIRRAAVEFVRAQLPDSQQGTNRKLLIEAGHLDQRLRLAACAGSLSASQPPGSTWNARNTVAVSCGAGATWTIYVPVTLESETAVLVTRRAVNRGASFTTADIEEQVRRVPGIADRYVATVGELLGRHARRNLPAGTALTDDALAVDLLVKRGQQVTLLASVGGIEVRAVGKALADGGSMDRIRVQNLNSARIVEGFVESADIVRISP
jgi:flagella basal body P-ring formation protein FlgA